MKIELKNLKINERLSEETTCFSATVYVDGKRAFETGNRGHGGCNEYHGDTSAAAAYAATLPPYEGRLPYDLDMLIDDLIEAERFERALKRDLKRVAFVDGGKYYVTKVAATPDMIAAVIKRYPTATILNTMPIADAIALCRSIGL